MSVKRAAELALRTRLVSLGVELDGAGRAEHLRQVVVDTVDDASLGQALADLREGSGGELTARETHRPKFHSAFSSCAFAVNVFGPTPCRSLRYCASCRQPFEQFKTV